MSADKEQDRKETVRRLEGALGAGDSALYYRGEEIVIEDDEPRGWGYVWKRPTAVSIPQTITTRSLEEVLDYIDELLDKQAEATQ